MDLQCCLLQSTHRNWLPTDRFGKNLLLPYQSLHILRWVVWGGHWSACAIACHVANLSLCCILRTTWTSKSCGCPGVFLPPTCAHLLVLLLDPLHVPPQGCTALVTGNTESWQAAGSQQLRNSSFPSDFNKCPEIQLMFRWHKCLCQRLRSGEQTKSNPELWLLFFQFTMSYCWNLIWHLGSTVYIFCLFKNRKISHSWQSQAWVCLTVNLLMRGIYSLLLLSVVCHSVS